jgi:hypothetical protein
VGAAPVVTTSTQWEITGLEVTTTNASVVGPQLVTVNYGAGPTLIGKTNAGTINGNATQIYGSDGTADGTVAQEFESAFPVTGGGLGNTTAVLATDVDPFDALSAAYLEGTLGTGLLITPPTSFGLDAQAALRLEGVTTVYVVGGPLAIAPSVISQIQATPAFLKGGVTPTGLNLKVVGPIYGATADDTAQSIATYFGSAIGSATFAGAYNTTGGVYNDQGVAASASNSGPTASTPTAIVISDTDYQDAMSIAPEAFFQRFPIILTEQAPGTGTPTLGTQASAALTSLGVHQVIVIGGQLAIPNTVVTGIQALNGGISVLRIAGTDATDTAAELANFALAAGPNGLGWKALQTGEALPLTVMASHADYWSDELGAAALGGNANLTTFGYEPMILVENPTTVGTYTTAELAVLHALGITNLTVLGGPLAMPAATVSTLSAGIA